MAIEHELEHELITTLYGAAGQGLTISQCAATAKGAVVGTAAGATTLAKGSAVTAFWKSTAFSVGMGIGPASWAPIAIGGLIGAGVYTLFSAMKQINAHLDTMELKL